MALYKGTTKLSGVGSGFAPLNQGNNGDVLKKSQFGYEWDSESVTSVNGQTGDVTGLAEVSDVLTKTNTTSFSPTGDYNPATKKYVDDIVGDIETLLNNI